MHKWVVYSSTIIFSIIILAAIVGSVYEMAGRNRAARDFPPPGKLMDIGGRRIQLDCRGSGSPTVVFESGLDVMGSLSWSLVHDEIAKTTRACAYSRAGIMWSDPHDAPQNGKSIAQDLHGALKKAGESGPFVMVGHSLGGPYIMTYTKYFGSDVAGLVFVDASHPDQIKRLADAAVLSKKQQVMQFRNKLGALLNWTGIVRIVAGSYKNMPNLPARDDQAVKAYTSTSLGPMLKESDAFEQTLAEAGTFRELGSRPLYVLTSMKPLPAEILAYLNITPEQGKQRRKDWKEMQDEEASWSSQSQHQLIPDAGHYIQLDRPDIVIAAVRSVVEKVRENNSSQPH
jgi:pimeloyl-ACP methyl ester carboxylesterase